LQLRTDTCRALGAMVRRLIRGQLPSEAEQVALAQEMGSSALMGRAALHRLLAHRLLAHRLATPARSYYAALPAVLPSEGPARWSALSLLALLLLLLLWRIRRHARTGTPSAYARIRPPSAGNHATSTASAPGTASATTVSTSSSTTATASTTTASTTPADGRAVEGRIERAKAAAATAAQRRNRALLDEGPAHTQCQAGPEAEATAAATAAAGSAVESSGAGAGGEGGSCTGVG
jgi:hypothetical protein